MKFKIKIISLILIFIFNINTVFAGALTGKKILIDPGHGGDPKNGGDPGAVAGGIMEKDLNSIAARKLADLLTELGAEVSFTRLPEDDIYITPSQRAIISNNINPDLFISIHHNSIDNKDVSGVETFYSFLRPNINSDRYVEYEGNKYEYLREENIDNIDYVYILVNGREIKVEKSKVKIVFSTTSWQALESKKIADLIVKNLASLGFKNRGAKINDKLIVTKNTTSPSVLIELGFISNTEEREKLINPIIQDSMSKKIVEALLAYFEQYENNKQKGFGQMEDFNLSLSNEFLLVGQPVNIKINSIFNLEQYIFKLEIKRSGETVYSSEYSKNLQYDFIPDKDGEYEILLFIKDLNTNEEYFKIINKKLLVYNQPTINTINLNSDKITLGNDLKVNVEKVNGSIVGCEYFYEVYKEDSLVYTSKSQSNLLEYIPLKDGEYKIKVKIKDKLSSNEYDDIKELDFKVVPKEASLDEAQNTNTVKSVLSYKRTLKKGMVGEDVKALQSTLIKLGYLKITKPTTNFGPSTEAAVKALQKANKLTPDGVVGRTTVDRINILMTRVAVNQSSRGTTSLNQASSLQLNINRVLKKGMTGQDVRGLQTALIKLGYLKITTPTTTFGPSTEAAVKALQKANRLTADGVAGKSTIDKINSLLRK